MFLYTSGSTGTPKGVVLSHQSHIWVVETRLAPGLDRHRYLIAAPLYHMNALALSKLACAAHATIVLLPQFSARAYIEAIERYRCTWLTAVPPMIAMMLREKDLLARTDLSSVEFIRMGSAPVSQSLMQAIHATLPQASVTNAYGTTEAGPVVFGPHPKGLPQPEMSVGYPHPKVELRLVDGENRDADQGVLEMRCPAVMNGYHNRPALKPPFTDGRLLRHRRRVAARRRRLPLFRRPHRRHVRVRRREHLSGRCRAHAGAPSGRRAGRRGADRRRDQGTEAGRLRGARSPATRRARTRSSSSRSPTRPAYAHPRFVWFIDELPLASTNKIDRNLLHTMAAERVAVAASASGPHPEERAKAPISKDGGEHRTCGHASRRASVAPQHEGGGVRDGQRARAATSSNSATSRPAPSARLPPRESGGSSRCWNRRRNRARPG